MKRRSRKEVSIVEISPELARRWAHRWRRWATSIRKVRSSEFGRIPARHIILTAYIECVEAMADLVERGGPAGQMDVRIKEYFDLHPYIAHLLPSPVGSGRIAEDISALELVGDGRMGVGEAADLVRQKKIGRPPANYLEAYILHWRHDLRIKDVVSQLCQCGTKHDASCENKFKEGIKNVYSLLRKYNPKLPIRQPGRKIKKKR